MTDGGKLADILGLDGSSPVVSAVAKILNVIWHLGPVDRQRALRLARFVDNIAAVPSSENRPAGSSKIDRFADVQLLVASMLEEGFTYDEIARVCSREFPPKKRPSKGSIGRWAKKQREAGK